VTLAQTQKVLCDLQPRARRIGYQTLVEIAASEPRVGNKEFRNENETIVFVSYHDVEPDRFCSRQHRSAKRQRASRSPPGSQNETASLLEGT